MFMQLLPYNNQWSDVVSEINVVAACPKYKGIHPKLCKICCMQSPMLGRAVAQAVSRRPVTAETGFSPRAVHVEFVMDKVALGQVSLRVLRFFPVSIIPPLLHIHSCINWEMDNGPVSDCISTET
jgi:hypothetical protein